MSKRNPTAEEYRKGDASLEYIARVEDQQQIPKPSPQAESWDPNDLDGSNGIKKQFRAKCHVEVGAGGFLRLPFQPSQKPAWLDERLMSMFVETEISEAEQRGRSAMAQEILQYFEDEKYSGDRFLQTLERIHDKLLDQLTDEQSSLTDEEYCITETDILVATSKAMKVSDPWKQATKLRDLLISQLTDKEKE